MRTAAATASAFPTVKFGVSSLEWDFSVLHEHLEKDRNGGKSWAQLIYNAYPGLADALKGKEPAIEAEREFFSAVYARDRALFEGVAAGFQKEWDGINADVMRALSEIVEQEWPRGTHVSGYVSLIPFGPRNINERSFRVFYRSTIEGMKATAIHETLHFIYFEKWKSVFPGTDEREFNRPHLIWQLSEMVTEILLNDARLQRVFANRFKTYLVYQEMRIDGKPLLSYLQKFYDEKEDFADFLKKAWEFVKEHQEEINRKFNS
ncbi:MAG: hypothetical protein LVQ95_04935 [Candidatus Micrarchaeales archaeon]|nr:hypothetical protein [Candidatus Micrarchaeales archaeon]